MISVKSFFTDWSKEMKVKEYAGDVKVVASSAIKIYRYLDVMLKHMPNDELKHLAKHYFLVNKSFCLYH